MVEVPGVEVVVVPPLVVVVVPIVVVVAALVVVVVSEGPIASQPAIKSPAAKAINSPHIRCFFIWRIITKQLKFSNKTVDINLEEDHA